MKLGEYEMNKKGELSYMNCKISWMVYGENTRYGGEAFITIHAEDTVVQKVFDDKEHPAMEQARDSIIQKAKQWLDSQIACGRFTPI